MHDSFPRQEELPQTPEALIKSQLDSLLEGAESGQGYYMFDMQTTDDGEILDREATLVFLGADQKPSEYDAYTLTRTEGLQNGGVHYVLYPSLLRQNRNDFPIRPVLVMKMHAADESPEVSMYNVVTNSGDPGRPFGSAIRQDNYSLEDTARSVSELQLIPEGSINMHPSNAERHKKFMHMMHDL